jgi:putative ABC transport system permease protein
MGLDDASLVGAPRKMKLGSIADLRQPDAVVIDQVGYMSLWPGEPLALGRTVEMNDRRGVVVGIADSSPPFQTLPVLYTRYSQAVQYIGRQRN